MLGVDVVTAGGGGGGSDCLRDEGCGGGGKVAVAGPACMHVYCVCACSMLLSRTNLIFSPTLCD